MSEGDGGSASPTDGQREVVDVAGGGEGSIFFVFYGEISSQISYVEDGRSSVDMVRSSVDSDGAGVSVDVNRVIVLIDEFEAIWLFISLI